MSKPTIFLDCDEVLADLVGGICKHYDITKELLLSNWELGRWDADYDIRNAVSKTLGLDKPLEKLAFWSQFNYNRGFWAYYLDRLPWAEKLLRHVKELTPDWYIVTSPAPLCSDVFNCNASHTGKYEWLWRNLRVDNSRVIITPYKHLLAKQNVLLIDDRESTCLEFCKAGGEAILFPAHHNTLYSYKDNPLEHVFQILEFQTEKYDAPEIP
jgi:5'(3')-deoxyribonucleotidase